MAPTILVVDDDRAITEFLTELLTTEGYDVLTASDGEAALAILARTMPDLVLSDVTMPRRDGLSLLQAIRHAGLTIPVVLMTALPISRPFADVPVIRKPFDLGALLTVVTGVRSPWHRRREPAALVAPVTARR